MSSSKSPELELDLQPPWTLLAALLAWLFAVGVEAWGVDDFPRGWKIVTATFFCLACTALWTLASGALATSLWRIVWASDGTWHLFDGSGREWSAALVRSSRHWGLVTLLVWSAGQERWWVILTPVTVGAGQYRRLSVRWQLQRHA